MLVYFFQKKAKKYFPSPLKAIFISFIQIKTRSLFSSAHFESADQVDTFWYSSPSGSFEKY